MTKFVSIITLFLAATLSCSAQATPTSPTSAKTAAIKPADQIEGSLQTAAGNTSLGNAFIPTNPADSTHMDLSIAAPGPFNAAETLQQAALNNAAVEENPAREISDAVASPRPNGEVTRMIQGTRKNMAAVERGFRKTGLVGTDSEKPNSNAGTIFFDLGKARGGGEGSLVQEGALSGSNKATGLARSHPGRKTASALAAAAAVTLLLGAGPGNLPGLTTVNYLELLAVVAAMLAPFIVPRLLKRYGSPATRLVLDNGLMIRALHEISGVYNVKIEPYERQIHVYFFNSRELRAARDGGLLPNEIGDYSVLPLVTTRSAEPQ